MTALRLWRLLERHGRTTSRIPGLLAVTAFAVSTGALLVVLGGLQAMVGRWQSVPSDINSMYVLLAVTASGLMVIPILTLGGQAARLTLVRRNQRLAMLRLAGATAGQTSVITIAETARQAILGAAIGTVLYGITLPLLTMISFSGVPLGPAELWLGPIRLVGVVAVVLLLAVVSGLVSLAGVTMTPLGVVNRVSPRRLAVMRLVVALLMLLGWPLVFGQLPIAALIVFALGAVATINLVGPYLVMLFGMILAAVARKAPTVLAARRIVDDPRTAWRSCSAFALVIMLATLSSVASGLGELTGNDEAYLPADLSTGALITLVIVSVVAATSSGVVHACRVIDHAPVYRSMVMAGTELAVLNRTRLREVLWPLGITALTAGGFAALLLLPLATDLPLALARFGLAVVGSAVLTVLALAASRPLLARTTRLEA